MEMRSFTTHILAELLLLISIRAVIPTLTLAEADQTSLYFGRFSMVSRNGMIVESQLELQPTETEYRMEGFQRIRAVGVAAPGAGQDITAAAGHDAVARILWARGLKSVSASGTLYNALADDRVRMNYEGVVRYPFRIVDKQFENGVYRFDLEVEFAPLAFPDQWSYLGLKYRTRQTLDWLLHFFW
ncbi:MAG: hypothetical protein ACOZF0_23445 [Thermodesulfobacteriota bacterium]